MKRIIILLMCGVFSIGTGWAGKKQTQHKVKHTAASHKKAHKSHKRTKSQSALNEKMQQQDKVDENPFAISLYHPTYLLPAYYMFTPYRSIYENNTPDQQRLQNIELKFQISFRAPIVRHLFSKTWSLNAAYTQQSWWQAYNNSPFFRETNYEPELFIEKKIYHLNYDEMHVRLFDLGAVHESNGRGGALERSWNRLYASLSLEDGHFIIRIKPWYIIQDSSLKDHNPDIADYLGYGNVLFVYRFKKLDLSFMFRNAFESNFSKGAEQLTVSYPLNKRFRLYVLGFSGYGQSLIEYNHYTNAVAIGFALNDYI